MGLLDIPPNPDAGLYVPRGARDRSLRGRVLFVEDFRNPCLGMWNDGIGAAYRDTNITFAGMPTARLDPQGVTGTQGTGPGTMNPTASVVFKRRVIDYFSGTFAVQMWLRWSASSSAANSYTTISTYNRPTTGGWYGRMWLDTSLSAGDPGNNNIKTLIVKVLNGTGAWQEVGRLYDQGADEHAYKLSGHYQDKAGLWMFAKLAVDHSAHEYVYCQVADHFFDLTGIGIFNTVGSGQSVMHFSAEYETWSASPARRWINIAQVMGTSE